METTLLSQRAARLTLSQTAPIPEDAISFDSGHAFPGILPDLTEEALSALSVHRAETLQYAPRPGLADLRDWIAGYMRGEGVMGASAEDVLVVNGAKHGLDLVCRLLLDEGDSIVVSAPTYFTAIPIFKSFGVEFIEIPQDGEGLAAGELEGAIEQRKRRGLKLPKFVYDVPDFHNPTGVTMTRRRREALLELCEKTGMLFVEDSPYRKVRFQGEPEPSMKALDRSGSVLLLGTFSKLLAPGLRIGWVVGSRNALNRMIQLKSDGGSCPLTQRLIVEFCKAGRLDAHIHNVQELYRSHRDRMIGAVRRELPEVELEIPKGGYYLWLTLPEHVDGDESARRAAAEGVIAIAGSRFFAHNGGRPGNLGAPRNNIRLAYSHATLEQIDEGVGRLARALHSMTSYRAAL
jgi:2-aminoadipate transaminase